MGLKISHLKTSQLNWGVYVKKHERTHVYAINSVIRSNIPTSSNSSISSSTPYLQQHLQQNQNQLLLQQQHQQQQQSISNSLNSAQSLLNHPNQSKDIIRTHEDYIRCKARIFKNN
jgi:hypothetical protein